jgi:acyl-CoA dehydrogenase
MMALQDDDRKRGLDAFDKSFWAHVRHSIANTMRAWTRAWTGGIFAPTPDAGAPARFYRQLGRYTSAFALAVDLALLSLGGGLKRQEMLSARFGDVLSELYLSSAVLKRWHDEGCQRDDFPLLEWSLESSFAMIETRLDEIIVNFPSRPVAWLLRFIILPLGRRQRGPSDKLTAICAKILTIPSATRDRLTAGLFRAGGREATALLERAFDMTIAVQPLRDRMRTARVHDIEAAQRQGVINAQEANQLKSTAEAVAAVIAVDDFAPEELSARGAPRKGDVSSPAKASTQPAAAE